MYLLIKRLFDIAVALLTLLFLMPFFIPLMIILRLTGEGKIFYKQPRVGKGGGHFGLIKFATMLENSPNIGTGDITVGDDPRVLPVGRFLRKTKINELPQLLNVLKGDMSIVGPRPLTPRNFDFYSEKVKEAIKSLQPGLTGIGSIVFRDEEAIYKTTELSHEEFYRQIITPHKGNLEVWYKKHRSLITDGLIIVLTAWCIIFHKSKLYEKIFRDLPEWTALKEVKNGS